MNDETSHVIVRQRNRIGHIQLNRPEALNSTTFEMIKAIDAALIAWEADDAIDAVVISSTNDRAFCAGGDIKSVYHAGPASGPGEEGVLTADIFRVEYTLNHRIANYPKPYVAWLDGITMGGGAGLSILGSHRIASEHLRFAMPETSIGFFPDVGASWFMSRLGPIGLMLSLTGQTIDYTTAFELGLVTHFVPRAAADDLLHRFEDRGVDQTLAELHRPAERSRSIPLMRRLADKCFTHRTMEDTNESLQKCCSDATLGPIARQTLEQLRLRSPTSLKITIEAMARGCQMSLADCLIMEYRICQHCMMGHEFFEGVRALLIDKDKAPQWSPESLNDVDTQLVMNHFQPLGDRELVLH